MAKKESKTDKILEYVIKEIMSTTDDQKREKFILDNKKTIEPMVALLSQTITSGGDDRSVELALNCMLMISCAATERQYDQTLCNAIINETHFVVHAIGDIVSDRHLDQYFGILVNLSRYETSVHQIHKLCPKDFLKKLFKSLEANELVPALIANLSQLEDIRQSIVSDSQHVSQLFDVFDRTTNYRVKNAVVSIVRNCCFDEQLHRTLLDPKNELVVKLVLPIAGPEELDEEDNSKLPIDLQYLGAEKVRERDPEIRKLLMESVLMLCSTRFGREVIRALNVYIILREYHKWEKVREVQKAVEDVVDILIKDESEINEDNLKGIDIPEELIEKFNQIDKELLKDDN